ncbi:pitrilysin family protein [Lyngbya sp. PCC 8106]|uniref:M16 family metallopeptidase n=1 Tax=Lyngbya sp. (strain PCC 8106) TaxID=313612 RepID=UPI0000EAB5CA|nr:pitrilysin family protein [Lyngbya sp. PCC 8106]EAW36496.1 processing protease [Lyngbya sp. PCC 8106]
MTQTLTQSLSNQNIHRIVLDNGIVVLVKENPTADIVSTRLFLRTGSCWETRSQAGLSHLLAATLTKGTENLSSLEIAEKVESVGARLSADTSTDYFLMSLKTVSADFEEILTLASQLLQNPSFPPEEVELERKITIQGIRSQQEQPFSVAFDQLRQTMYPDHPYAFSTLGIEETISQVNRTDLETFHHTYFRPDRLIISIVGHITIDQATTLVNQVFGNWQVDQTPVPPLVLPTIASNPKTSVISQETQQSVIMLGYLTCAVDHQDYAVLKLINTYLGNGLSSRLFVELREKRGLAYDVSAFYPTRLDRSQFVAYMGTAPENTAIAIEGLRSEVERLAKVPLTEAELQVAKNKLLGQYALGKQTNAQLAQIYGWYETLGLGIEFDTQFQVDITQVTADDIYTVANRYFSEPYMSLVGPEASVQAYK